MSLSVQFFSLLAMIGTGIFAGVIMDIFGTVVAACDKRSVIRRRAFWFELGVWILLGISAFWILILVRGGAWRMYDPVAQISGMLLYVAIFHYPFRMIGRVVLIVVIRPIWYIILLVLLVIRRMIRVIVYILSLILAPFVLFYKNSRKFLQNKYRLLYNKEQ
ncbi:hypothetical protein DV702_14030 [Sporosarcina sp. PTS2304]|uniref:spore cortex biosynthesis protein YabQ n=1 Tax=Sporosarcina sp. PTS2304 TaxID=2283194 RepID=UPI000E0CFA6C|nr:spore cortex biosynthesis protein YabQ [Sporosarcina sp. PTS2304]AXI00737.1 hypothetical protein DV702_14030 [Sporosarcina sp. PTS2304]